MMLINILTFMFIFLFVWFTSFLWHELMHCLCAMVQGGYNCRINVHGLGMTYQYSGVVELPQLVKFAGGVFTSVLIFVLLVFFSCGGAWSFSFWTLGWVQLCYGMLEGFFGCKYRYVLYVIVVLLCVVWWFYG